MLRQRRTDQTGGTDIRQRKPSMAMHGLGMTAHLQGTEGVMSIVNLALLTGNIGKPGPVSTASRAEHVQGRQHMGCDPGILTGSIAIDAGKDLFESVWKMPVPMDPGLNQLQMIDAARNGKQSALGDGYEVFLSNANATRPRKLSLIWSCHYSGFFMNETAKRFGPCFFPATSSLRKDGHL